MPPKRKVIETEVGPIVEPGTSESKKAAGKVVSKREAALLGGLMSGKTAVEAVKGAGYEVRSAKSATAIAEHVRGKYTDKNGALVVALEDAGVTLGTLAQKVADGLEAKCVVKIGKTIVGEAPDLGMRHKYLETALDIVGGRAPTKQVTQTTITTHEKTIAIVAGIKENPEVLDAIRKRLESRKAIDIEAAEVVNE